MMDMENFKTMLAGKAKDALAKKPIDHWMMSPDGKSISICIKLDVPLPQHDDAEEPDDKPEPDDTEDTKAEPKSAPKPVPAQFEKRFKKMTEKKDSTGIKAPSQVATLANKPQKGKTVVNNPADASGKYSHTPMSKPNRTTINPADSAGFHSHTVKKRRV